MGYIDIHTHTFPEKIAARAVDKLQHSGHVTAYSDGTCQGLIDQMARCGFDYSVIVPVVTRPEQYETINRVAASVNETTSQTGLISFGGIHPDNENYIDILTDLKKHGFKGIKLHPVFQETDIDDPRYLRIIDCASELGLLTLIHGGYDFSFPGWAQVTPEKTRHMLDEVHPSGIIMAHMGGWGCWDAVWDKLIGQDICFDVSFTYIPVRNQPGAVPAMRPDTPLLPMDELIRMIRTHGADRILFGSDSPWSDPAEAVQLLRESALTPEELNLILDKNARRMLGL